MEEEEGKVVSGVTAHVLHQTQVKKFGYRTEKCLRGDYGLWEAICVHIETHVENTVVLTIVSLTCIV
jgi:hypothetical protein